MKKAERYKQEFGFQKAYGSYEELIADKDAEALYIPLPNNLHKEWVIKALNAGKHVLCEKPLALNAEDAKEMFAAAKANNVFLMEAYAYLHSPYIASLKEDIGSGIIGDVDFLETAFYTQGYYDDIRIRKETGGGAVYDLGCYCTTMILSLIDSDIDYVKADAEFNENGVDIFASALMRFTNGVRAAFNVGMIFDPAHDGRRDRLYVHGSKGIISSEVEFNQAGELSYKIISDGVTTIRKVNAKQNYALEIEQLGRVIENGEERHITPEFSVRQAEVLDMVLSQIGY